MPPDVPQPGEAERASTRPRRRAWTAMAAVVAAAALVTGAVTVSSDLRGPDSEGATLRGFQIRVLNVSQAAAENRLDGALDALEALQRDLDLAAAEGLISAARYRGIDVALDAVREDVTRSITAQSAVAEAEAAASAAGASTVDATTPEPMPEAQAVQLQPEAPAMAPVPEPAPQEKELPDAAKEAKGKGKGAGKP